MYKLRQEFHFHFTRIIELFSIVLRNIFEFYSSLAHFKTATTIQFTNKDFISYAKFFFFLSGLPLAVSIDVAVVAASAFIRYILEPDFMKKRIYSLRNEVRAAFTKCCPFTLSAI